MSETIETLTQKLIALAKSVEQNRKTSMDNLDTTDKKVYELNSNMKDVLYKVDLLMKERSKKK